MKKLAVICSHPIQYYAPVFQLLSKRGNVELKVFYTGGEQLFSAFDKGFKKEVTWDIPLLEGYAYQFLENTAKDPGTHHFSGIKNPAGIKEINAFKPDAILVYGWAYQSHLGILRYFKGKLPVYFRGDSTLLDQKIGLKNTLRLFFLRWVYTHIDHAFYVGSANKQYFKAVGLKENQLIFAPHATDNTRFGADRQAEANAIRNGLGLNATDILLLFAGKLEPKKDPALLLEIFSSLDQPNVHLLFVGNGILEKELKENSHNKKTAARIHFMDFRNQSEMPVIYQSCDLFCLPSKGPGETWGLAVNEAMAAGKAILVSDKVGCAQDLVKNEVNGYIFESGNDTDLRSKLGRLCQDKNMLEAYGKASAEIIKNWSFTEQAKTYEQTIS